MKEDRTLQKIHDDARERHIPVMLDDGLAFLLDYIRKHEEIRDILEVGTAVGYSAMRMALVRWDMQVDTLETDPDRVREARKNIEREGLSNRVHCYECDGEAFETEKIYDLIFIDAAKSQYRRYLEHFYRNSHAGSVFVFDNLCFHGMVDDESLTSNRSTVQMVHKVHRFRDHLLEDDRFDTAFYPERGDGIAFSVRRAQ